MNIWDSYRGGYTIQPWKGGERPMTNEYVDESRDRDVHFLFDKEKWCDRKIGGHDKFPYYQHFANVKKS